MVTQLQSVGMIEFTSIAAGIEAADRMMKASLVEPLMLKTICPGKFVVAVHGDVAAVQSAVDAGMSRADGTVADHFVIPNINEAVVSAMACATPEPSGSAVGVIETFSAASSILAADTAAKTADVDIAEVRIAMGLGGKAFCILTGDVAAVNMAVEAASNVVSQSAMLVRKVVIPSAAPEVLRNIL
ncbi:BMC domain-containing protein [Halodesulfovibrio sp.]|uniref:BMC domain-containing protein n=1 Tax=Halodesulfovibrio sp. TaxID=1912772 RepID=UPI0025BF53A6|nr:BMC domain-containing protein [Halodesulfovibrio sp.]